jgi:hypothetical protein
VLAAIVGCERRAGQWDRSHLQQPDHGGLAMNILAMDLGKYKTVFCDYNTANAEHTFGTVKTTPQKIHDLIVEKEPDRVIMEILRTNRSMT